MGDQHKYRGGYQATMGLQPSPPPPEPPRPLSKAEQARVAEVRAQVHEHIPEALPFIKQLHEFGMIEGWRNVKSVTVSGDNNG